MGISSNSLTVLGTACPWKVGSLSANVGSAGVLEPYNTPFYDGSVAGGGSAGQNSAYPYGKLHTHAGETSPTTLSVTPGQVIFLEYVSGLINTQGAGATSCGPAGAATTGLTPLPPGGCDNETMPTNVIKGYTGINATGTVNTSGTAVTWASGTKFSPGMVGGTLWINNVAFVISSVSAASNTSITLATSAGTQTGVTYFFWGASTSIGGLVGAFTDSSGNIVGQPFDWASYKGINPAGAFTLASVAVSGINGVYNGTITGGGSNLFVGYWFTITGCTNAVNNGTFWCVANGTTSLTLVNPNAIAESHAASAQQISVIALRVPIGATKLSLGINDTQEFDNTSSFSVTAILADSAFQWAGTPYPFPRWPFPYGPNIVAPAFMPDRRTTLNATVAMSVVPVYQISATKLPERGQIFPRQQFPQGKS